MFLDGDSPNELDAIGRTTAMYATNGGSADHLNCLKFLIARGVDLNHQSNGMNYENFLPCLFVQKFLCRKQLYIE